MYYLWSSKYWLEETLPPPPPPTPIITVILIGEQSFGWLAIEPT